jgi:putative spermidine/putrescine transport system permease protein
MLTGAAKPASPIISPAWRKTPPSQMMWLIVPAVLLFLLFFVLPFGVLGIMSFLSGSPVNEPSVHLTLRHYERFLADDLYLEALWATLRIGLITTLAALLIGYPLAHLMARARSRIGHAVLLMAVIAPMLTGIVVRTFAWIRCCRTRASSTRLLALGIIDRPLRLMYNEFGTIVALTHIYVPFMVLTLAGVIGH